MQVFISACMKVGQCPRLRVFGKWLFAKDEVRIHDLIQETLRHVQKRSRRLGRFTFFSSLLSGHTFTICCSFSNCFLHSFLSIIALIYLFLFQIILSTASPYTVHCHLPSHFSYILFVLTFHFPFCSSYWYISIFSRLMPFFMYSIRLSFVSLLPCLCLLVTVADRYL